MGEIAVLKNGALIGADEVKVLRDSLFRGFTDAEVNYSLAICNQLQLNPLLKQIHFIKRSTKAGPVITAQTGIDGFRLAAQRAGGYAGSDDAVFEYGPDKKPTKAVVTVYKMVDGQRCPFTASARIEEYYQAAGGQWDRMVHVMLAKCAEALALRKAFPAELSALRSDEEMHQADGPTKAQTVQEKVMGKAAEIEATATVVDEPSEPEPEPSADPQRRCSNCNKELGRTKANNAWYCSNYQDKRNGEHDYIKD
jgi:phage recombination protein Bet